MPSDNALHQLEKIYEITSFMKDISKYSHIVRTHNNF